MTNLHTKEETHDEIIKLYALEKHPAGCGYYKETFRSPHTIFDTKLEKQRSISTQIISLFYGGQMSPFHKVGAAQLISYNSGNTNLLVKKISDDKLQTIIIGNQNGQLYTVIPPNTWFALILEQRDDAYRCISTHTVVPGFDFDDFSFATIDDLKKLNETDKNEALAYLNSQCSNAF